MNVGLYQPARKLTPGVHPYVRTMEEAVLDGQATARAMVQLKEKMKFVPDVIMGHTGWGSMLYAKDIFPDVPMIGYFEWYYHAFGSDVGYWKGEKVDYDSRMRIRTLNALHLLNLSHCDVRYTPTEWQKKQFPPEFQASLQVAHEGIDTDFCCPKPGAGLVLPKLKLDLSGAEEIVTYVSRGLEPYRGFPQFMAALRILMKRRPKCHVVIVGRDRICYGGALPEGQTWKKIELAKGGLDMSRIHFTDLLTRGEFVQVMQASAVHVYLTRPFVLSWSMLEAMSAGCCLVASATPPVEEVVEDGVNGLLVNFRSPKHIAMRIEEALENPELRARLGKAARETVLARYNLKDCLRRQMNMIYGAMK